MLVCGLLFCFYYFSFVSKNSNRMSQQCGAAVLDNGCSPRSCEFFRYCVILCIDASSSQITPFFPTASHGGYVTIRCRCSVVLHRRWRWRWRASSCCTLLCRLFIQSSAAAAARGSCHHLPTHFSWLLHSGAKCRWIEIPQWGARVPFNVPFIQPANVG